MKNFGCTLNEVAELLQLVESNEATCNNVSDKIAAKVELPGQKINEPLHVRNMLFSWRKNYVPVIVIAKRYSNIFYQLDY